MIVRHFFNLDFILILTVSVISGLGLTIIYSMFGAGETAGLFLRQLIYACIGIGIIITIGIINYDHLRTYSTLLYMTALCALAYVLMFGVTVNGTAGWIDIGVAKVQPVEFAKISLIIFLAHFISTKRTELGEVPTIIGSFFIMGIVAGFTLRQPDTGSALVVVAIWFGMIVASGIKKRYLFGFVILGAIVAVLSWSVLAPYQQARITNFLQPQSDPKNTGYNVIQSMIAVGNGGATGRGVGYGTQSQLNFLPEKHTDFIFASYVEAFGFVGAAFLLILFLVVFVRLRVTALYARDAFGYFLTVGITILLFVHVAVNIGMNMGVLPVTGIPLPFVSYGGSAIISMALGIGIVQSVYRHREKVLAKNIQESY